MNRNRTAVIVMEAYPLKGGYIGKAFNHNYRVNDVPNADPARLTLDRELSPFYNGDEGYSEYVKRTLERYKDRGLLDRKIRSNAIGSLEIVVRANGVLLDDKNHPVTDFDSYAWAEDTYNWVDKYFNPEKHLVHYISPQSHERVAGHVRNVYSAVLHMDESTPHIHFMILPIDEHGHLNSSAYRTKEKFYGMQDSYYLEVGKKYGLERGVRKSPAKAIDISKFHTYLNEAMSQEAPIIVPGESIEVYKKRADEEIKKCHVHMRDQDLDHRREKNHLIAHSRKIVESKNELIKDVSEELFGVRSLEIDLSEVHTIRSHARAFEEIKEAVDTCPDRELAQNIIHDLHILNEYWFRRERERRYDLSRDEPER